MPKPWYKVITPRPDLREGKPLDAAEFAIHLDQVRDGRAPEDYQHPERFFERTYLTAGLTDLAAQVVRRLSGQRTESSAVFNLATQFGGGKTHALTLLYHLAKNGPAADGWLGVPHVLEKAGVKKVPQAAVAVFVGTEFDSLTGRGGKDGTPLRKTPWGEIAYQLGGEPALQILAEHESQFIEPKGDVIREFLPKDRPSLILLDEIINYASTYRSLGYHNRLYNFIQALSETARGMDNVVLVVSIPASELEYTADDEADEQRFKKMLDRVGKAVIMSAETETAEIIRRRLFEWDPRAMTADGRALIPAEADQTCRAYADWVLEHRLQLPSWFPIDSAYEAFRTSYPFHPTVLSVFERKWQVLPRFQRTRGILRLLALWVARAYQDGYKGVHRDTLIGFGTAPLDASDFRAAVFEQLGESRLEGAVTTDICGKKESHSIRLDDEAVETIRKSRLHRKAASTIFFESNGGQSRGETSAPEVRLAIGEPDLDIGNVETVLEGLRAACYYITVEGNRFHFSTTANLNKLLSDRHANVADGSIDSLVCEEVQKVFSAGGGVDRVYFPEQSNQSAMSRTRL
jgi:predicted AAA+ superfamily ATPase